MCLGRWGTIIPSLLWSSKGLSACFLQDGIQLRMGGQHQWAHILFWGRLKEGHNLYMLNIWYRRCQQTLNFMSLPKSPHAFLSFNHLLRGLLLRSPYLQIPYHFRFPNVCWFGAVWDNGCLFLSTLQAGSRIKHTGLRQTKGFHCSWFCESLQALSTRPLEAA